MSPDNMRVGNIVKSLEEKLSPNPYPTPPPPSSSRTCTRVVEPANAIHGLRTIEPSQGTVSAVFEMTPITTRLDKHEAKKKEILMGLEEHFSSTKKLNSNQDRVKCNSVRSQKKINSSSEKDDAKFSISSRNLGTPDEAKMTKGASCSTPISALVNHCRGTNVTLTPLRPDSNNEPENEEHQYGQSTVEKHPMWHFERTMQNQMRRHDEHVKIDSLKNDEERDKDEDEEQQSKQIITEKKSPRVCTTKNPVRQRREAGKKDYSKDEEEQNERYDGAKPKSVAAARWTVTKDAFAYYFRNGFSALNYLQESIGALVKEGIQRSRKIPATLKISAQCVAKVEQVTLLAFISLMLSFTIQVYPTAPRCDSGLAIFVCLQTMTKKNQDTVGLLRFILCLHLFSIALDIDWLVSDYYPQPMNASQVQLWYQNEYSTVRDAARYLLFIVILTKVAVFFSLLSSSTVGTQMLLTAWSKVKAFLPVATAGMSNEEIKDMLNLRVLSLIWLELLGSTMMLILGIYAQAKLPWAPQFLLAPTLASFLYLLYAKAASGVIVVAAILRNCTWLGVASAKDATKLKVLINRSFLRFNGTLKFVETCLGILLWINLAYAWNLEGTATPKEVNIILIGISITMVLTECVAGALWITIWCHANNSDANPSPEDEQSVDNDLSLGSNSSNESREEPSLTTLSYTPSICNLDDHVSCEPSKFSMKWKLLPPGFQREYKATKMPTMSECEEILLNHRFFPVASGTTVNDELKMFRYARHEGVDVLCELKFNSRRMIAKLHMKVNPFQSASSARITFLLEKLPLQELFGALPVIHNSTGTPGTGSATKNIFSHPR